MSQHGMRPFALAPGEGTSVENPTAGVTTFKATSDQSGGGLTAIEGVSAPGEGPPLHVHREQDEFIHILEGTYTVKLGDDLIEAPRESFVFYPTRHAAHLAERRRRASALPCRPHTGERGVRGVLPALRRVAL